jgi:Raf kinase inhibitor-like YbhB/YbcL family protein
MPAAFCGLAAAAGATFQISSADLPANKPIDTKFIYSGFGCTGQNLSPVMQWSNVPAGTQSFALMVHDPDAPTGGAGFWHWVVVDIPASVTQLPQGAGNDKGLPAGARQLNTDFGVPGWGGPCPPQGDRPHRYVFTVYALKVDHLDLPPNATASLAGFNITGNALGKASFTRSFGR